MQRRKPSDVEGEDRTERGHPEPPETEEPGPLPGDIPTWGPVEYDGVAANLPQHTHLGDPTRRKHPTILSEEGQEEAPENELPPEASA